VQRASLWVQGKEIKLAMGLHSRSIVCFLFFLFVIGLIHLFEKNMDDAPTPILGPIVYTLAM
jgi:hypothetical protein